MKPMKKLVRAALALSMLMPGTALTAAAASAATSADFKDLASVDTDLKAKVDAMLAAGVFEGVSADTFGIQQNMTRAQFAKVLDLVYGIKVDSTVTSSSFTDVKADDTANGWSIPYVEAAKKAGLIDGMTDTTFAPGDSVTLGQFATALLKGLSKPVDMAGTPWYADAMKQAVQYKLLPAGADGDALATRADLVGGAYAAKELVPASDIGETLPDNISIASVKATDAKTVQVSLSKSVNTAKATLAVTQGDTVVPTSTAWSADGTSATLTVTGTALATGDYTVTLSPMGQTIGVSAKFHYDSTAANDGSDYSAGDYVLGNVLDSGLTDAATGTDGFVTKSVAEDPTKSKLATELVITAKNAAGEPVGLPPGIIQSISSSNLAVVKVGVTADHKGYMLGNKAGTAVVSFTYQVNGSDTKQGSVNVTVKSDPIAVAKLEAENTSLTEPTTVTGSVYKGYFDAYEAMDLKATDNYGVEYDHADIPAYNFALGIMFTVDHIEGDASAGPTGTVLADSDGTVFISGNVTGFELTAVSASGKKVTSYVTVEKQ
jgi:hypothetical protein